jgi:copper(I)-binding protein
MTRLPVLIAAAALFAATTAAAHAYRLGAVEVDHPWSRPAAAGMTGVGYMAIRNTGKTPVVLTGATTPLAAKVSLHQTSMAGGVMRMAPVRSGVTVAPGATVALAPAGYHFMLEGLKAPLVLGRNAPLTLTFADGRTLQVELAVQTGAATGAMPGMKH